jgi:recombination protein RecA
MKIGVMFGSPETTTGGNALKFYASQRLDIRRIGSIKKGEANVGSRTRVKVVKNKLSPPFKEAEFDILFGGGISKVGEIVDLGSDLGIIDKSGSWFSFEGNRIGQGRDNAVTFLQEHAEVSEGIEKKIRTHFGLSGESPAAPGAGTGSEAEESPAAESTDNVTPMDKRRSKRT